MQSTITQQLSQIQQHKDQYNILKLKLGTEQILDKYHLIEKYVQYFRK